MTRKRRTHSPEFKARLALEALTELNAISKSCIYLNLSTCARNRPRALDMNTNPKPKSKDQLNLSRLRDLPLSHPLQPHGCWKTRTDWNNERLKNLLFDPTCTMQSNDAATIEREAKAIVSGLKYTSGWDPPQDPFPMAQFADPYKIHFFMLRLEKDNATP
jgi:hypothetical protein